MSRIYYQKLVRDGIKSKIESKGESCKIVRIDDDVVFKEQLRKKIAEEAGELASAPTRESFLQEYADLMVALDALTSLMEFSEADIKTAIEENVAKKGFYKERHFLEWADEQTS